jgi:hypothetical protein
MSFLEKEEGDKASSFWDWVVGIGVVVVVVGFTVFYQYQKRASISRFQEADSLFQAGKIKDAAKLYEELKSAQYLTNKYDSIIYARLDTIETLQEMQNALVASARKKAVAGNASALGPVLDRIPHKEMLSEEDKAWVDSVIAAGTMAAATAAAPHAAPAAGAPATGADSKATRTTKAPAGAAPLAPAQQP